jgi:hypothetical protein
VEPHLVSIGSDRTLSFPSFSFWIFF